MDKQITLISSVEIHWVLVVRSGMWDVVRNLFRVFGVFRGPAPGKSLLLPAHSWFLFSA